jgi:hypothetical protein
MKAKPRMSKSVRIAERNMDATRIPEDPSTTMPVTVDKIIPSASASRKKRRFPSKGRKINIAIFASTTRCTTKMAAKYA